MGKLKLYLLYIINKTLYILKNTKFYLLVIIFNCAHIASECPDLENAI